MGLDTDSNHDPAALTPPETSSAMAARRRNDRLGRRTWLPPWHGLRGRIIVGFALATLALSAILSILTYALVRTNLVRKEEDAATSQVIQRALTASDRLRIANTKPADVIAFVEPRGASRPWLSQQGRAIARTADNQVPQALELAVTDRANPVAARQRFRRDGKTYFAVGITLPAADGAYFEVFDLDKVEGTLSTLATILTATSALTTLGGAAVGLWLGRRVVRPLDAVTEAARAIAAGRLDARIDARGDADLRGISDAFNQMADALVARIERDSRFASDVSHELRSPLTTLTTTVEVLKSRRAEMSERSQRALDLLADDVQRFQQMVQDLLEISRYDAGAAAVSLEQVKVSELLTRALAGLHIDEVDPDVDPGAVDALVAGDKRRLERVVANLVANARTHGGGVIRVGLRPGVDPATGVSEVWIEVDDQGAGVPVEDRERIFDRFARGQAARRRGRSDGVGLGLALVAEHVRLHGGRIWVTDRPGGGARFTVALPRVSA